MRFALLVQAYAAVLFVPATANDEKRRHIHDDTERILEVDNEVGSFTSRPLLERGRSISTQRSLLTKEDLDVLHGLTGVEEFLSTFPEQTEYPSLAPTFSQSNEPTSGNPLPEQPFSTYPFPALPTPIPTLSPTIPHYPTGKVNMNQNREILILAIHGKLHSLVVYIIPSMIAIMAFYAMKLFIHLEKLTSGHYFCVTGSENGTCIPASNISKDLSTTEHPGSVQPIYPPTLIPTPPPTISSTQSPSALPSLVPSSIPSTSPVIIASNAPTVVSSEEPSTVSSANPSDEPLTIPSSQPSIVQSEQPSMSPNRIPSLTPSQLVSNSAGPSEEPSLETSSVPSGIPSFSLQPTGIIVSDSPSAQPSITQQPTGTIPSDSPSTMPSVSMQPTEAALSDSPSSQPSLSIVPTELMPSDPPSTQPSVSQQPTAVIPSNAPSGSPSVGPSQAPSEVTVQVTFETTPFTLQYDLTDESRGPLEIEVTELTFLTDMYLRMFMSDFFGENIQEYTTQFVQGAILEDDPVVFIEYKSNFVGLFNPSESPPTVESVDILIARAFSAEGNTFYLNLVQTELPQSNLFRSTSTVIQIPGFPVAAAGGTMEIDSSSP
jgi:hypothetical protein